MVSFASNGGDVRQDVLHGGSPYWKRQQSEQQHTAAFAASVSTVRP